MIVSVDVCKTETGIHTNQIYLHPTYYQLPDSLNEFPLFPPWRE